MRAERAARELGKQLLAAARAEAAGLVSFSAELRFGEPADVICEVAQDLQVDLIAVGTRGLGRLERLVLGSVSLAVIERAHCSVVVVRPAVIDTPGQ